MRRARSSSIPIPEPAEFALAGLGLLVWLGDTHDLGATGIMPEQIRQEYGNSGTTNAFKLTGHAQKTARKLLT